jgi:hypothetical protein
MFIAHSNEVHCTWHGVKTSKAMHIFHTFVRVRNYVKCLQKLADIKQTNCKHRQEKINAYETHYLLLHHKGQIYERKTHIFTYTKDRFSVYIEKLFMYMLSCWF